jgi:hypothetical protein
MKHLRNLGAYNKALAAGVGSLATVLSANEVFLPGGWVTTALGVATVIATFLVTNQDRVDAFGDDLADALEK